MADLTRAAKNAAMLGGICYPKGAGVNYDEGLQRQYFAQETREYAARHGEIASDVYEGTCQGLDRAHFYDFKPVLLRSYSAAKGATGETMPDDWQRVHLLKPKSANELPPGAYLTFANNTWIVYKGTNIGSVLADGIVRRCNAVIHTLDWYGNIVGVPMSYAKMGTLGNASHASENSIVAKNYISCVCQKNAVSADFRENTRFILGNTAYSMRGVNDFTREFTDEADSVHLMSFTIEMSEPMPQDSIERQCADYFSFRWEIGISGENTMKTGTTRPLSVKSARMGAVVESTEEKPISYLFSSSDESVATVDENGSVTAVGEGSAEITVTLEQNPSISATWGLSVEESPENSLSFTTSVPAALREYESAVLNAAVFENGEQTEDKVNWTFTGAAESCYDVSENEDGSRTITCTCASTVPLTVTIHAAHGLSESRDILLTAGR